MHRVSGIRVLVASTALVLLGLAVVSGGLAREVFRPVFADEPPLEGLVVSVNTAGNVLYLVLNYDALQPIDISRLGPDDRAELIVGKWVKVPFERDGTRVVATGVEFVGECLDNAKNEADCDPGSIGGTNLAPEIVARYQGQTTGGGQSAQSLPPLPPAGPEQNRNDNGDDGGGNDNGGGGNDNGGNDNG
jgi:hypothetical protein